MTGEGGLVSVVVIFLNAERFLDEAIRSVLAQTYTRWEIVLVDDGSTDRSSEIARGYANRDPSRIRCIGHDDGRNHGMSASRNAGARASRGDYLAFLDADDVWLPTKLEEQVRLLEREPEAGLVYGRARIWWSWTGDRDAASRDHFYELGVPENTLVRPPRLFLVLLANQAQTPMSGNALIRRSLFEQIGGFDDEFRGMFEDQVFFAKTHLASAVYVAGACWMLYRQHAESCSASSEGADGRHAARLRFVLWLDAYVAELPDVDDGVRMAVRREVWRARRRLARHLASTWRRALLARVGVS